MLLFTSSSSTRAPKLDWRKVLGLSSIAFILALVTLEYALAKKGYRPTIVDSPQLWSLERERASKLGKSALVLIGGSRIQLGIDLSIITQETRYTPVQLAIDGSSFIPTLENLANDASITGTILISYIDHIIADFNRFDAATVYRQYYENNHDGAFPNYKTIDAILQRRITTNLRSYADGARPITSLLLRAIPPNRAAQYITTHANRSRSADYTAVNIEDFYLTRVLLSLHLTPAHTPTFPSYKDLVKYIEGYIANLPEEPSENFNRGLTHIRELTSKIEKRGGRVIFLVMPSSGMIRNIEKKRYPKALFWEKFIAEIGVEGYHFEDHPQLASFNCPDGSHLDFRDKVAFTKGLIDTIKLK